MPRFVARDEAADFLEFFLAGFFRESSHVTVRYFCGPLLKRCIDESEIGVGLSLRIETVPDEILNRNLHCTHIDSAGKIEVAVQKIAMTVFLRRPAPTPLSPPAVAGTAGVGNALQPVEPCLITWQRLLCNHVANENNEKIIRNCFRTITKFLQLLCPIFFCHVGKEIRGLPAFFHRLQQCAYIVSNISFNALYYLKPL